MAFIYVSRAPTTSISVAQSSSFIFFMKQTIENITNVPVGGAIPVRGIIRQFSRITKRHSFNINSQTQRTSYIRVPNENRKDKWKTDDFILLRVKVVKHLKTIFTKIFTSKSDGNVIPSWQPTHRRRPESQCCSRVTTWHTNG